MSTRRQRRHQSDPSGSRRTPRTSLDRTATAPATSTALVLAELLIHGPLARADLAERLGLSTPTLTRLTKPLLAAGLVQEQQRVGSRAGRPRQPLAVDHTAARFVGAKITRQAVHLVVTDLRGTVLSSSVVELATCTPGAVCEALATVIDTLPGGPPLAGIGLSLGGHSRDGRTVTDSRLLDWRAVPLADLVEERFEVPAAAANDVNALAQAEHWFGDGRDTDELAVVTIGTGIGLGLVAAGEVLPGHGGAFGAIGHLRLPGRSAQPCELGHHDCISTLATNAALQRLAGSDAPVEQILDEARVRPELAAALAPAVTGLGQLLATIVNLTDPAVLVLSGEAAGLAEIDEPGLECSYEAGLDRGRHTAPAIVVHRFEFDEWARGAAAVAIRAALRQGHLLGERRTGASPQRAVPAG